MKNLLKYQETMIIKEELYQVACIIKIFINSVGQIYQDKQILIQANTIAQQINFTGKLEENDGATVFFIIAEKQQKTILNFSSDSLIETEQ